MGDVRKNSGGRRGQFEIYWKTQLRAWLAGRKNVAGSEIGAAIGRLQEFSQLVENETFEVAAGKILGGMEISGTAWEVQEKLADRLSRGLHGTERKIVRKSLQETFLYATGVHYDLPLSAFGRKFRAFLQRRGSGGLIGLFLRFLLFSEICMTLHVPLRRNAPDVPALEAALKEIDSLCLSAVDTLDTRTKWPKLNRALAGNLIDALESAPGHVRHHSAA